MTLYITVNTVPVRKLGNISGYCALDGTMTSVMLFREV